MTSRNSMEDNLRMNTLEGKWGEVIEMYYKFPIAQNTIIQIKTVDSSGKVKQKSMGTALHMAVNLDEENVVLELLNAIKFEHGESATAVLEIRNEDGDTPLHIAAAKGFGLICQRIIETFKNERTDFVHRKNYKGETPLFQAAINGKKLVFAYLSGILNHKPRLKDLIRSNGDTILQCAIRREHFGLAAIIMHYHGNILAKSTYEYRETALKALAAMPSAFESSTYIPWWRQIFYRCINVEAVDAISKMEAYLDKMDEMHSREDTFLPENYVTLFWLLVALLVIVLICFLGLCFIIYSLVADSLRVCTRVDFELLWEDIGDDNNVNDTGKWLLRKEKNQHDAENPPTNEQDQFETHDDQVAHDNQAADGYLPPNYATIYQFVKYARACITGLPLGILLGKELKQIRKIKKRHLWGRKLFDKLMMKGETNRMQEEFEVGNTILLVSAENGIVEMVNGVLDKTPSVIHDTNPNEENVLLVAVRNRKSLVVESLRRRFMMSNPKPEMWNTLTMAVDKDGNTALHLAANALERDKPWQLSGSAFQMMWDVKWFQYIKDEVPEYFCSRRNKNGKTPEEIFKETHSQLRQESGNWLKDISDSCSVVAVLIASVSYATVSQIPGGTDEEGKPHLQDKIAFHAFVVATLMALCLAVTGLVMFLSMRNSRKKAKDFGKGLPLQLLIGLTSLLLAIVAMLVSFCTGHSFEFNHKFTKFVFPIYVGICLPVLFYAVQQLPIYFDILSAVFVKVPNLNDEGDNL